MEKMIKISTKDRLPVKSDFYYVISNSGGKTVYFFNKDNKLWYNFAGSEAYCPEYWYQEFEEIKGEYEELNYEDVARELFSFKRGFYTGSSGEIIEKKDLNSYFDANNSTTYEQLDSILCLNMLCNVAKYLNDGWLPNWNDKSEKWYIYLYHNENTLKVVCDCYVCISSNVYFKTTELAKKAIQILGEETIKNALTLNH